MNKILSIIAFFWITVSLAQIGGMPKMEDPVKWTSNIEKVSDTEYNLVFKATIEDAWHLYSQYNPEGASLPIEFYSDQADSLFTFEGKALESPTEKSYTKVWDKEEIYF